MKKFCTKDTIKGKKRQSTEWEMIIAAYISDKGHIFRLYKYLLQINKKKRKPSRKVGNGF